MQLRKLKCVKSERSFFEEGKIYTETVDGEDAVVIHDDDGDDWCTQYRNNGYWEVYNLKDGVADGTEFEDVTMIDEQQKQTPLDKRKNGKLRLDLVDTGFPNALAAIADVMTWARNNKGYLDDDWKNIDKPFRALQGASSRHKNLRLQGIDFDDESGKLHLSHEAFNVLALLELTLTGKLED